VVMARKGVGIWHLTIDGIEAHAGVEPGKGANALVEMAHKILTVSALANPAVGTTVNAGVIAAVPSLMSCRAPAVPKLLDMISLKGAIVTADALNRQRTISAKVVGKRGDYVVALKGNQDTLFDDVRAVSR
jgi:acetylornithine deacetylase/succinyl-diaminopimelate desuccinylase-like protein